MHILELDSYNLSDTVKFHDRLNPRLWNSAEHLQPDVAAKLMEIARDFQEFMGVPDLDVVDITISGSNAAYNYTGSSDIDLHLVINIPKVAHDEVYRELFNAKKYEYNDIHNIRIGGADVELYAQDSEQPHHSQGIYSLLNQDWISVPRRRRSTIDDVSTRSKYEDLAARVDSTIKTQDRERMISLMAKIKTMRQTGLEQQGEFGSDNLAFKLLRNNGYIKRLIDARNAARDAELSLAELARPRQAVTYGFTTESPDGVNPTTKMFLENEPRDHETTVQEFIAHVIDRLGIDPVPEIILHSDSDWSKQNHSFGRYNSDAHSLEVNLADRHVMDILRTVAHELVHCRQNQQRPLPDHAGQTGSPWENDANARAGVIMRDYAESNPEKFTESASGYIPRNRKEARDPRFSMALTQDIRPGQVGREANKLGLKTDANGKPALLMKSANALRESKNNLSEIDRRGVLKAIGAGAAAAAVPGVAQAGPFVDVAALGKSNPEQAQKVWTPRYQELTVRCQVLLRQLIAAAGPKWAPLLKGTTIRVVSSNNYAQASAISRAIFIDLSVFWDAPDAALAFTIAHELGHIALEHGAGTDDESADYKTQLRVAALYRQGELDADEFAVRICKVLGYNKAEVFKFIAKNEEELQLFDLLTQSPTSSHPSQKSRIERARMNGFQLSRGGIEQMNVLKQHLAEHDTVHSDLVENLQQEFALYEDQDLFEINMSPTNLKKLAAQTGALAGMEFEMIVPGIEGGEEADLEPDYDQDERVASIEDAAQFFFDGDYNGRREVQRLRESMSEDYQTWLGDAWMEHFESYKTTIVFRYGKENWSEADIVEIMGMDEAAAEALATRGATPEDYMDAAEKVIADGLDPWLNDAQEDAQQEYYDEDHEDDWLASEGLRTMSDVENQYEISWPYWSSGSNEGAGIESVADEFREAIGRKVNWSDSYHGGKREDNTYVVEPDGSLIPGDSDDAGLEFVSPPLPIDEMISDLNKVKAWADQRGCYTSKAAKTGLHINVSVPGFDNDKLDYVKLALLLGDEYVLNQFGRLGNSYANSAMGIIKERIAQRPEDAAAMLQKMKTGLGELATKVVHSGSTSKFTSINTKDGYIEFRSPGGDWLGDNFDKIETTLMRFVVALDAAMDPAKYLQEYQQKLYKLLTGQQSGRTKSNLQWDVSSKAMIWTKDQRFARGKDAFTARQTPAFSTTVTAKTAKEAWEKAKPSPDAKASEYKIEPRSAAGPDNDALLKIFSKWSTGEMSEAELSKGLRQAQLERKGIKTPPGDSTYTAIPSSGNQKYEIQRISNDEIVGTFNAASDTDASAVARRWLADNGLHRVDFRFNRATGQEQAELRTGASNYNIYQIPDGRTVSTFYAADQAQADAKFTDWLMSPEAGGRDDFRYAPMDTPIQGPAASTTRPRPDIIDIEPDVEQNFVPGSTQDIQQRRAAGGEFTGSWQIVDSNGNELHRFSGIGNSQTDANRVAAGWLARAGYQDGLEVAVVPVMS